MPSGLGYYANYLNILTDPQPKTISYRFLLKIEPLVLLRFINR